MYYPYFISYMAAGFIISIVVFFWALNKGQFNDQQRARFLPLNATSEKAPAKLSRIDRIQTIILVAMACSGLAASVIAVTWMVLHGIG